MNKKEIVELTKSLENMQGCPVMDAFETISFQEQLKTIREIMELNRSTQRSNGNADLVLREDIPGVVISNKGEDLFWTSINLRIGSVFMLCHDHKTFP